MTPENQELLTGEVLASGRLVVWDRSGICEISEFIACLCTLCLDVLGYGTCKI